MVRFSTYLIFILTVLINLSCKEGPMGPPGSGLESLVDPGVQPRVIYTNPSANSVGPYGSADNDHILVRFNKIMNGPSTRNAITLSSPTTTVYLDTFGIYSSGGDIYYMYPSDSSSYYYTHRWKLGETYLLNIASTARDFNGNSLMPAFTMSFQPEPFFRVKYANPSNGATKVYAGTSIYLYLNSAVDTSMFSSIQISPPIAGSWMYSGVYEGGRDSTALYYSHKGSLSPYTAYTITVNTTAKDIYGHPLSQQFVSTFTTRN